MGFSMGFKPKKVATSFRGFGFVAAQDLPLPPWASNMQMMSPLLFAYEEGARGTPFDSRTRWEETGMLTGYQGWVGVGRQFFFVRARKNTSCILCLLCHIELNPTVLGNIDPMQFYCYVIPYGMKEMSTEKDRRWSWLVVPPTTTTTTTTTLFYTDPMVRWFFAPGTYCWAWSCHWALR